MQDADENTSNSRYVPGDHDIRMSCLSICGGDVGRAMHAYQFVTGKTDLTPIQEAHAALNKLQPTMGADLNIKSGATRGTDALTRRRD